MRSLVCLLAGLLGTVIPAADSVPEVIFGTVASQHLLHCYTHEDNEKQKVASVRITRVAGDRFPIERQVSAHHLGDSRWGVAGGYFWTNAVHSLAALGSREGAWCVYRFHLPDLLEGRFLTGPGAKEGRSPVFADDEHAGDRWRGLERARFLGARELFTAYAPRSERAITGFMLTNVQFVPRKPDVNFPAPDVLNGPFSQDPKVVGVERWTLTIYHYEGDWDETAGEPIRKGWKLVAVVPGYFKEPFHAFAVGQDYYFVTNSGKVYHCPEPEKGKQRLMACIWDDAKRPVVAALTDADASRTFLFCAAKPGAAEGVYFDLAPKPKPVEFTLAGVPASKLEGTTGRLQNLARFLAREKKLKVPPQ